MNSSSNKYTDLKLNTGNFRVFGGGPTGSAGAPGAPGGTGSVGPTGLAGANTENFSIYLSSDFNATVGSSTVLPWSSTLNTTDFPTVDTNLIYQNLSYGSINLSNGTFSCAKTGKYRMTLSIMDPNSHGVVQFGINNISTGAWVAFVNSPNASFPGVCEVLIECASGSNYNIQAFNNSASNVNITRISSAPYNTVSYPTLIWNVELIDSAGPQGIQGPTGPQGLNGVGSIELLSVPIPASGLAGGQQVLIKASSGTEQYIFMNLYNDASNTTGFSIGVGDRDILITDGINFFGTIQQATLVSSGINSFGYITDTEPGYGIKYPFTSPIKPSAPGANIYATYSGGTTDYASGQGALSAMLYRYA